MKNQMKGTVALLIATVIWGSAFIAQRAGMVHIGPFTFQAVRCFLAAAVLFPCSRLFAKKNSQFLESWKNPVLWKTGSVCGAALFVAAGLQQMALVYTSAGKAGFITAMYIVLVPVLGLFLGKSPGISAWISVGIAVVGLYLLSCVGVSEVNIGDLLLLGCALGFAVQIRLIDRLAGNLDGVCLNCVQSLVCSVLSALCMFLTEDVIPENILACAFPLCYAGIASMGIAYTLQILGQKYLEPTKASLIMSLESVFALLCGWLILHETMTVWEISGCILMLTAVILSQIPITIRTKKQDC